MHRFDGDPFRHQLVWVGVDVGDGQDETMVAAYEAGGMVFISTLDDLALAELTTDGRVH